mgnify:CR=1 FL=1
MNDMLVSQWLALTFKSKPSSMTNEEWDDLCNRTLSLIRLHLAPEVLLQVLGEDTVTKLWDRLKLMYEKTSLTTQLYTTLKLMNFKMAEGKTLQEHIDNFNLIIAELASLNEKVEDEKKALHLLTSLPRSYEHLV